VLFAPASAQDARVYPGVDGIQGVAEALAGLRLGVVTHHAALAHDGQPTALVLYGLPRTLVTAVFAPEHGFNGSGSELEQPAIPARIPVYDLFGRITAPTRKMLASVDVLVIDLQDVGVRPFTYASTMALVMGAARQAGKPVVVLDRPNPMGGVVVDGPVLEPQFRSFIGMYPIPYVHGMTIGELAQLYNQAFGIGADLRIVPMRGWVRRMHWSDTGLPWPTPSPGLLTDDSPQYYATTGAIDGTNLWNGVSTDSRFRVILARWIDGAKLAERLNRYRLPGVVFTGTTVPHPVSHRPWSGVRLQITDPTVYQPLATTVYVLVEIRKMYGNQLTFLRPRRGAYFFDHVWGTREVRLGILRGDAAATIVGRWQPGLQKFLALRQRFLLYPDAPLPIHVSGQKQAPAVQESTGPGVLPIPDPRAQE
jgi:uncharacterized protein YbbC (DUF1343 family)